MKTACSLAACAALSLIAAAAPSVAAENDAATLARTRTITIEAAPPCDQIARTGEGHTLEVGADSVTLRIEFELGTDTLSPGATAQLDRLAATLRDPALITARFMVAGHTDARGGDAINLPLSCRRALAVRDYLQSHGIKPERLQAEGFGARLPLPGRQPLDGANRRVEIRRLGPQKATP